MIKLHHPTNKAERLINAEKKAARRKRGASEARRLRESLKDQETSHALHEGIVEGGSFQG